MDQYIILDNEEMSLPFDAESTLLSFPRDITLVSIKHKRMQILRISDNFRMYLVAFTQSDTRARLVLGHDPGHRFSSLVHNTHTRTPSCVYT